MLRRPSYGIRAPIIVYCLFLRPSVQFVIAVYGFLLIRQRRCACCPYFPVGRFVSVFSRYHICYISVVLCRHPVVAVVAYVFDIFLRSAGCIRDRYLCRVLSVFVICVSILQSCLVVNNLFQHARLQAAVFCFEIRVFYYACIARRACFLLFLAEQPAVFVVGVSFHVAVDVRIVLHGLFVVGCGASQGVELYFIVVRGVNRLVAY
ncbi:unknown [Subdoligranulum sp. CAG:314]|nr:unknown [Subdoligranulum sp. CAG:314]